MAATGDPDDGGSATGWVAVTRGPGPRLRGLVRGFGGFQEWGVGPVLRRELPGPEVTVIVNLSDPLVVRRASGIGTRPVAFVAGVGHSSVVSRHAGAHEAVEVRVPAPAAGALLGVPAGELAERVVDLTDLWGPAAGRFAEQLSVGSWEQRLAVTETVLADRLARADGTVPPAELTRAYDLLLDRAGDVDLVRLRELTGWSRRQLAEQFRQHIGLTPKALSRLLRFRRAERLVRRPDHRSFASIAVTCGYYDRAHFNREFRELAGCNPTEYVAGLRADAAGTGMSAA